MENQSSYKMRAVSKIHNEKAMEKNNKHSKDDIALVKKENKFKNDNNRK